MSIETTSDDDREMDWEGLPVSPEETPDSRIKVWQIRPHPYDSSFDACIIRSWHDVVKMLGHGVESILDRAELPALAHGVAVTFKVIEMSLAEYMEIYNDHA